MSFITNFFIKCSGANEEILAEIPPNYLGTEKTKFVGIGAAIFFTSCLAFVSSSFALSTIVQDVKLGNFVVHKLLICISFGLLWSFMIFNLDRYIVSSMRKEGTIYSQFLRATPRILIALLFSIIISKPLELEIFRTEIEAQLPQTANQQTAYIQKAVDSLSLELVRIRTENDTLRKKPFDSQFVKFAKSEFDSASEYQDSISKTLSPEINNLNNRIYELTTARNNSRNKIRQIDDRISSLNLELNDSINVVIDKYSKRQTIDQLKVDRWRDKLVVKNANDELPALRKQKEVLEAKIDSTQVKVNQKQKKLHIQTNEIGTIVKNKISKNESNMIGIEEEIEDYEKERKVLNEKFTGLLARLKALDDLKSTEGNVVILIASTLVFLIFLFIEMAPVLVKLMSKKTMYDQILEAYEMPIPDKKLLNERINNFFKEDARLIKQKKKVLRKFYAKKLALQEDFLAKSLVQIKENERAKFKQNKDEYSSYISDNPNSYLETFKSNSKPISRKNGTLTWEEEDFSFSLLSWINWKRGSMIAAGVLILILTIYGINQYTKKDKLKESKISNDSASNNSPNIKELEQKNEEKLDVRSSADVPVKTEDFSTKNKNDSFPETVIIPKNTTKKVIKPNQKLILDNSVPQKVSIIRPIIPSQTKTLQSSLTTENTLIDDSEVELSEINKSDKREVYSLQIKELQPNLKPLQIEKVLLTPLENDFNSSQSLKKPSIMSPSSISIQKDIIGDSTITSKSTELKKKSNSESNIDSTKTNTPKKKKRMKWRRKKKNNNKNNF